jgi:predicted flap endonuclease-1-like 5' DNA nuclease
MATQAPLAGGALEMQAKQELAVESELAEVAPDNLELIEGIGPKIAELLKQAGHGTFAAIAAMSPAAIKEILAAGGSSFNRANPESWPEQAALAAANRWAELKALQDRLNAGVA